MPTLILWGAQDRWVPAADAFRFQNDIKGAKLEIFEKLGHNPMEEDPKATAAAVAAFLAPIPAAAHPAAAADGRSGARRGPAVGRAGEGLRTRRVSSAITLAKASSAMASISALVRFWMGWGT